MTIQVTESVWFESEVCSLEEVARISGLAEDFLLDLIETGVLEPSERDAGHYLFDTRCIAMARTARRLRDDFELDHEGLALAMRLLRRVDELEAELRRSRR